MKINSDFIWAILLIGLAAISFWLGTKKGRIETEEDLKRQIEEKVEEISVVRSKNQQLSEELTSRGIYSYPQANILSKMEDSVAVVLITLNGKDALKNLEVKRSVIHNYSTVDDEELQESLRNTKTTDFGTLKMHNPAAFDIPMTAKEVAISLIFDSESNQWNQHIRIKKSPDGKIRSFWVITNRDEEVIDKHIDPGFPTDSDGRVVLSTNKKIKYSDIKMNSTFRL